MQAITANELKSRGVTAIEAVAKDEPVAITVRGTPKYVVLPVEQFDAFAEYELDRALAAAHKDLEQGNYQVVEDVDAHVAEIMEMIERE